MIRAAIAVVATAAAGALLVLALQVHRWESALRGDDLRFQVAPGTDELWDGPSGPGSAAARRVLGVADDIRFRRAEQSFVRIHTAQRTYSGETQRLAEVGEAQSTLEHLSRSDPSPSRRARAATLLGILLWEDATSAQDNGPLLARQSLKAFRDAVRDDASTLDAKYDLELLSTILQPKGDRRRDAPSQAGGGGLRGAGLGAAGKGY